jgi:hypothetical protein
MPINVTWQNEDKGIAYTQFIGHWNMKQFQAAWKRSHELINEQAGQRVDFILDLRQSILIPPDFVRQFRQMPFDLEQNLGQVIFVGADEHLQLLIVTIIQSLTYDLEVGFAETVDEALVLITDGRQELMALTA